MLYPFYNALTIRVKHLESGVLTSITTLKITLKIGNTFKVFEERFFKPKIHNTFYLNPKRYLVATYMSLSKKYLYTNTIYVIFLFRNRFHIFKAILICITKGLLKLNICIDIIVFKLKTFSNQIIFQFETNFL